MLITCPLGAHKWARGAAETAIASSTWGSKSRLNPSRTPLLIPPKKVSGGVSWKVTTFALGPHANAWIANMGAHGV